MACSSPSNNVAVIRSIANAAAATAPRVVARWELARLTDATMPSTISCQWGLESFEDAEFVVGAFDAESAGLRIDRLDDSAAIGPSQNPSYRNDPYNAHSLCAFLWTSYCAVIWAVRRDARSLASR